MNARGKNERNAPADLSYLGEEKQRALVNRLARLEGHVRSVRRMVEERRCADEILLQVSAVKAAMNQFAAVLLQEELNACMSTCMTGDSDERLQRVTRVLSTLLRQS